MTGKYSWQLLFDIDNPWNSGFIRRKEEVRSSLVLNYNSFVRDVKEAFLGISRKIEAGVTIKVASVSVSHGLESKVSAIYEKTIHHNKRLNKVKRK